MKARWVILISIFLIFAEIEIWEDPYHKYGKVNFWTWAFREIDELLTGEKG